MSAWVKLAVLLQLVCTLGQFNGKIVDARLTLQLDENAASSGTLSEEPNKDFFAWNNGRRIKSAKSKGGKSGTSKGGSYYYPKASKGKSGKGGKGGKGL